jgi:hypothetical protein
MIQETSVEARNKMNMGRLAKKYKALLESKLSLTDQEASMLMEIAPSTISGIRCPLVRTGAVVKDIKRKCRVTGNTAFSWKLASLQKVETQPIAHDELIPGLRFIQGPLL